MPTFHHPMIPPVFISSGALSISLSVINLSSYLSPRTKVPISYAPSWDSNCGERRYRHWFLLTNTEVWVISSTVFSDSDSGEKSGGGRGRGRGRRVRWPDRRKISQWEFSNFWNCHPRGNMRHEIMLPREYGIAFSCSLYDWLSS